MGSGDAHTNLSTCSFPGTPVRKTYKRAKHHCEHTAQVKNILKRQTLQTKLSIGIGSVNDRFEQVADRVADHILRMPDSDVGTVAASDSNVVSTAHAVAVGDGDSNVTFSGQE